MAKQVGDIKRAPSPAVPIQDGSMLKSTGEDARLQEMGYEQQMKRGFNFWSMTAFCLTGLGFLPSLGGEPCPALSCPVLPRRNEMSPSCFV